METHAVISLAATVFVEAEDPAAAVALVKTGKVPIQCLRRSGVQGVLRREA